MKWSIVLGFAALAVALPQRNGRGGGGRGYDGGRGGRDNGGRGGRGGDWDRGGRGGDWDRGGRGGDYGYNNGGLLGDISYDITQGITNGIEDAIVGCVLGGPWNCRNAATGEAIPEPAESIKMKADAAANQAPEPEEERIEKAGNEETAPIQQ